MSQNSLGGWFNLYKFQDSIIGVMPVKGGSGQYLFWNHANNKWSEALLSGNYMWAYATADPENGKILFPNGYKENEQLVMSVLIGKLAEHADLQDIVEREWTINKNKLVLETGSNVVLNVTGKREGLGLGVGILDGPQIDIPYSLHATTIIPPNIYSRGPFNVGVFHSADFGKTWLVEKIADFDASGDIYKTKNCYYYFMIRDFRGLWFSRKSISDSWDAPKVLAKTFGFVDAWYAAAVEGDKIHVCWMDRRHNKWRFNPEGPLIENDDIYYCYRKDTDSSWSKQIPLSKGLEYCYPPSISTEGQNVVVAWAGIQSAGNRHSEYDPNDIYYVTSKDSGKTWTKPLMVTDKAKDSVVSGRPKAVLLNGIIHLLFTQGQLEKPNQISPGLTKLNQPPWPIYYTQRPFPD